MDEKIWGLLTIFLVPLLTGLANKIVEPEPQSEGGGGEVVIPPPDPPGSNSVSLVDQFSFAMSPSEKIKILAGAKIRVNGSMLRKRLTEQPLQFGEPLDQVFESGIYCHGEDDEIVEVELLSTGNTIAANLDFNTSIASNIVLKSAPSEEVLSARPFSWPFAKDHPWLMPAINAGDFRSVSSGPAVGYGVNHRTPFPPDIMYNYMFRYFLYVGRINLTPRMGYNLTTGHPINACVAVIGKFFEPEGRRFQFFRGLRNGDPRLDSPVPTTATDHHKFDLMIPGFMQGSLDWWDPWFHSIEGYVGMNFNEQWADPLGDVDIISGRVINNYLCRSWNGEAKGTRPSTPWSDNFTMGGFILPTVAEDFIKATILRWSLDQTPIGLGMASNSEGSYKIFQGTIQTGHTNAGGTIGKLFLLGDRNFVPFLARGRILWGENNSFFKLDRAATSCAGTNIVDVGTLTSVHPKYGFPLQDGVL